MLYYLAMIAFLISLSYAYFLVLILCLSHPCFIASDMSVELLWLLLFPVDLYSMLLKDCEEWLIFRHTDL